MELEQIITVSVTIIVIGLVLGIGIFVLSHVEDETSKDIGSSQSELILADSSSPQTLTETPTSITSTTVYNQTWLEFDGVDDNLTVLDDSYLTVSYWYRNSTIDWQNVINSSGTTYVNGSLASPDISPVFTDGSIWVFGMEDESTFIEVSIDEIRFYNGTINSTIAQEIYDARR